MRARAGVGTRTTVVVGALIAALGLALFAGWAGPDGQRRVVPLVALPVESTAPAAALRPVPAGRLDQARPTGLRVPALGLDVTGLVALGRDAGGVLQMPPDPATAGWSTVAPTPGALGPAVIAADGAGLFGRLAQLAPGAEVAVDREDGTEVVFTVYRVERFDRATFPGREVWGDTPAAELRLVTAGGVFDRGGDPGAGNVVVFARLAGVRG